MSSALNRDTLSPGASDSGKISSVGLLWGICGELCPEQGQLSTWGISHRENSSVESQSRGGDKWLSWVVYNSLYQLISLWPEVLEREYSLFLSTTNEGTSLRICQEGLSDRELGLSR